MCIDICVKIASNMIMIYLKGPKKSTNGFGICKNIQIEVNIAQNRMNVQKCKTGCHLGKCGRHLGFSNGHLFGFDECFKIYFVSIIMFLLQI